VLGPGEGARVEVMGARITVKATGADTGGAYGCLEYVAPPAFAGPPPHLHRAMEEAFVVLEGELTLRLGDREVVAGPGAFVQVARGTPHAFANRAGVRQGHQVAPAAAPAAGRAPRPRGPPRPQAAPRPPRLPPVARLPEPPSRTGPSPRDPIPPLTSSEKHRLRQPPPGPAVTAGPGRRSCCPRWQPG
jgi:mannose-6-phosphate isomerase-like protein (cupin superfamily)